MKLFQLLHQADTFRFFTYLYGNNIPYLYGNFNEHLAFGNANKISSLQELKSKIGKTKLFGHFSYDVKNQLENLKSKHPDFIQFPEIHFYEPQFYFNNQSKIYIKNETPPLFINTHKAIKIKSRFTKEEYISTIHKLKKHIIEGDCYEINFCIEFYSENVYINPIDLYTSLNKISPMPFSALHKVDNNYVICASPERFIKKQENKVISQPIKGTIKKGSTISENNALKQQLLTSEKERAENLMIVDLVRNDLAKTAKPGSVIVDELFGIYDFSSVNQMISTITSEKRANVSSLDVILNAFPMGSMTGAPKHKVMNLIERYEKTKRGLYSGSIGFFDENENFDFNVVIRSIMYNAEKKYLSFQVGGAITYDSEPEQEYNECLLKASSIIKVLGHY